MFYIFKTLFISVDLLSIEKMNHLSLCVNVNLKNLTFVVLSFCYAP